MGDSGSLVIGMFISVLSFKLIEFPIQNLDGVWVQVSKPVFVISALIYPLLDTLRVFILRAIKGQSPFTADRTHIHHMLLDCGYSHVKTVIVVYVFTVLTIAASFLSFYFKEATLSLITVLICSISFLFTVIHLRNKHIKKLLAQ